MMKRLMIRGFCFSLGLVLGGCQTAPPLSKSISDTLNSAAPTPTSSPLSETSPVPSLTFQKFSRSPLPSEEILLQNCGLPLKSMPGRSAQLGFILYDPVTKKALSSLNADQAFIPSSVMKVVSTVAALKILGPDFRFRTDLKIDGKVHQGVLRGNLYLKGTGDPFLTSADLMSLALAIQKQGIRRIEGGFFFDETFLIPRESIDENKDVYRGYNAGVSALSAEFNQIPIRWKSNPSSFVMQAYATPDLPLIELGVSQELVKKDEKSRKTELNYQKIGSKDRPKDQWLLSQSVSTEGRKMIPIKQPGLFTAYLLRYFAEMNGVYLPEPLPSTAPRHAKTLYSLKSLPLVELVQKVLEYSNNLMAELIQLRAARQLTGKALTLGESSEVIRHWLKKEWVQTDWHSFVMENGSGLGSLSRVSPKQLADVLRFADRPNFLDRSFLSLLPISGWKGTLSNRMNDPDIAFHVWAKTGTQTYSNALAGYLFTRSGRKLIFSFLATHFEERMKLDKTPVEILREHDPKADAWLTKTRVLQEKLLLKWVQDY